MVVPLHFMCVCDYGCSIGRSAIAQLCGCVVTALDPALVSHEYMLDSRLDFRIRQSLHDIFMQKRRFGFRLPVRLHEYDENAPENGDF